MTAVTVRFLGGLREDFGSSPRTITLPDEATLDDLEPRLREMGIDLDSREIIVTLNDRGLRQWPAERRLVAGDVVTVFPNIAGG